MCRPQLSPIENEGHSLIYWIGSLWDMSKRMNVKVHSNTVWTYETLLCHWKSILSQLCDIVRQNQTKQVRFVYLQLFKHSLSITSIHSLAFLWHLLELPLLVRDIFSFVRFIHSVIFHWSNCQTILWNFWKLDLILFIFGSSTELNRQQCTQKC